MSYYGGKKILSDIRKLLDRALDVENRAITNINTQIMQIIGRLDALEARIDSLAHSLTLSITAPVNGATIRGSVTFSATCTCPSAHTIKSVIFYIWDERVGWVKIAEDTVSPYETTLDTTQYSNAKHKLRIVGACVSAGQSTAEIEVTIDNVIPTGGTKAGGGTASYGDVVSVQILSPAPGSELPPSFNIRISASCSAGHPITSVTCAGRAGFLDAGTGTWLVPAWFSTMSGVEAGKIQTFTVVATCAHGTTGSASASYYNAEYVVAV